VVEESQEMSGRPECPADNPVERIAIVNGPSLNLLGMREVSIYGDIDLGGIEKRVRDRAIELNVPVEFFQSNHEGELIDYLQATAGRISGIILNPAGLTHTSVSLRDCLLAVSIPFVEVHISNIFSRETFRSKSLISDISVGLVCGLGWYGYVLALEGLVNYLRGWQ